MMVRCVVGAMTRLPSRHRCCVLPAIASATMGPPPHPDGAVHRLDLPSLTVLSRAIMAFGYTTARGRVGHNLKRQKRPYFP